MKNPMTGEVISDQQLAGVTQLVELLITADKQIEEVEAHLKQLTENRNKLSMVLIPDKMAEIGMSEFRLTSGAKVTVKPFYSGKIIEGKEQEALKWLDENQHGGVIKSEVQVPFERGKREKLEALILLLSGNGYNFVKKEGVHAMTMKALLRELTEEGKTMPPEYFTTFVGKTTKVD